MTTTPTTGPEWWQPGDLVFAHGSGVISRAIRAGEWIRWRGGSNFNHMAILDKKLDDGTWTVIQAEARGVTDDKALETVGASYVVIELPTNIDRAKMLTYARLCVGREYGFITCGSVILTIFSPKFVNVMMPGTLICSALAADAMGHGGWMWQWPDVYQATPAQVYEAVTGG